jgi:hypothetical protein
MEAKMRTITLTDRAPVRIREDEWPEIARGDFSDGNHLDEYWKIYIRVRKHQDGRVIVYGTYDASTSFDRDQHHRVGVVVGPADASVGHYIKLVASQMVDRVQDSQQHWNIRKVADDTVASLPVEDI